jgi:hypothetical protein
MQNHIVLLEQKIAGLKTVYTIMSAEILPREKKIYVELILRGTKIFKPLYYNLNNFILKCSKQIYF